MTFWILIALAALAVSVALALALLRRQRDAEPAAAYDLRVYRDQLREVDRDLARGVIGPADAERARTEVSRRILAADAQLAAASGSGGSPRRAAAAAAAALAVVVIAGSLLLYRQLGAPGYGDLSQARRIAMAEELHANRPDQAAAEAQMTARPKPEIDEDYARLIERLRDAVARRPEDLQGQMLLARHSANTGDFIQAYRAQERVIAIKGDAATAEDFAELAELMIMAAGGYVSPEAEQALRASLARDPGNGAARYYWGLMQGQTGRPDLGFRTWDELLRSSPPDAGWVPAIEAQIGEMAWRAGVDYSPPAPAAPPLAGPTGADMANAADMTPEERQQMIRGMVERLNDRLATEGGSPAEWARLIGALGVLGETDRARAILAEATTRFGADAQAMAQIDDAARRAGIAE